MKMWDWKRILLGEAPPEFLIEVLIRTVIMFVLLFAVVRLMGKRMSGQISVTEMGVMITLGAIVSPAMQLPDRAVLFGLTALLVILFTYRFINSWAVKSQKMSHIVDGRYACLVKDGILQLDTMRKTGVSRQELFAQLRKRNIETLSQVDRVYLEACGLISVFKNDEGKPGLALFPEKDGQMTACNRSSDRALKVCANCGHVQKAAENEACSLCGHHDWIEAYV